MSEFTDWTALHQDAFAGIPVLVTGGAGFIGSHLAAALAGLGAEVRVVDDLSHGDARNLEPAGRAGKLTFTQASILDPDALAQAARGCRHVFHLAALGSVPRSIETPGRYTEVNILGTEHVLAAARDAGCGRLVFSASSSAYGQGPELPKVETLAPDPQSPYAATKLAGEHLARASAACYPLDTVSLRYFNIFGPRQRSDSAYAAVIAAFARALITGQAPVIHGDGTQSRDFTYVDNAVHANLLAARAPRPLGGRVLNVATGRRITVNRLAEAMAARLGTGAPVPVHRPPRPGDVRHSLADLTAARAQLGYEPIVDFDTGLEATCRWYAEEAAR